MHKPAQVKLQLDRPQLPYSEILRPIIAEDSLAHYRRRQPNIPYSKKKAPTVLTELQALHADLASIRQIPSPPPFDDES